MRLICCNSTKPLTQYVPILVCAECHKNAFHLLPGCSFICCGGSIYKAYDSENEMTLALSNEPNNN